MKSFTSPTGKDFNHMVVMRLRSNIRFLRTLFIGYWLVIGLLGTSVQVAHSASIATDGDIVGDGVSLGALKATMCDAFASLGLNPLPAICLLEVGDRFVFVTSTASTAGGNFLQWAEDLTGNTFTDGLLAGDAVCQSHADNATPPLPGRYKAWLSTISVDAKDRVGDHTWIGTNGVQVAGSLSELLDCSPGDCLDAPILSELGAMTVDFVYTGTTSDGTGATAFDCDGWTSDSALASLGFTSATGVGWTEGGPFGCTSDDRLYCFGD